jgi:hypothetical protein
MKDKELTKGELRKLNMYRKSVQGDEKAAQAMFSIWKSAQPQKPSERADPVAQKLVDILAAFEGEKVLHLGNKGYTVKRAKGKGAKGYVATKNVRPLPSNRK